MTKAAIENHTLADALVKAKAENKLVLVDVAAIWCSTCRRLDNNVFADPQVRKIVNERYVFARLEYESAEGAAFLKQHEAAVFPSLWVLDGKGNVVKKLLITFEPSKFLAQLP